MTITTKDGLWNALANNASRVVVDKLSLSNTVANQYFSMWRATGQPGQGAIPTTAAICNKNSLVGPWKFTDQTDPVTNYLGWAAFQSSNASMMMEIHDKIAHMGGLSGTSITSQTVNLDLHSGGLNPPADRIGDSNFSDIMWWLEGYTDTGITVQNLTINVTYNDGSSNNLTVLGTAGSIRAGRMIPLNGLIPSADFGKYIRDINTVQASASSGTVGNYGFTATRLRASIPLLTANRATVFDAFRLGAPEVENEACLIPVLLCSTTTTGTLRGNAKLAHG